MELPGLRTTPTPVVAVGATTLVVVGWAVALATLPAGPAQLVSNVGLAVVALTAGLLGLRRARRDRSGIRRFWLLLGLGSLSWGAGQAVATWYQSVLGREVPLPSLADLGYLGLPPLAALAMVSLPITAPSLAGRLRSLVDGLVVASSFLLTSWVLVLRHVVDAGADSLAGLLVSLAYPVGDVVVMSIVVYSLLRARRRSEPLPVPLGTVGAGLLAFSFSDSSFVYLSGNDTYSSGSLVDVGWFAGFAVLALASTWRRAPRPAVAADETAAAGANLLPYVAVGVALVASGAEVLRTGQADVWSYWLRTLIVLLVLVRQVLTLRENRWLTRGLEARVEARTAELSSSRERFAALVQHSSDLVTVIDTTGTVTYQSATSTRVLGVPPEDLVGHNISEVMDTNEAAAVLEAVRRVAPGSSLTLQNSWRHATGRRRVMEVTVTDLRGHPDVAGLVLNARDVTDRVELERQLTHQAFTDSLTGLPNRALFLDRLRHGLQRRGSGLAVLFIDLDGFKTVNDTLGHGAGDALLVEVADRLTAAVRPTDTVARFGGDEFAVLLEGVEEDDATFLADRLSRTLRGPYAVDGDVVHAAGSIGIAVSGAGRTAAEDLLREADLAMYQAKAAHAGGYAVFHPSMHEVLVDRVRLESDLRQAVAGREFRLAYQPMIDMTTGRIRGVEALARWHHPERGEVSPVTFIPVAESTGLIVELGRWVLHEACRQAVEWTRQDEAAETLRLSVNLSGVQLQQPGVVEMVKGILAETGFPADHLTLEMTESVLVEHDETTLATLHALRAAGIKLAIDDFGTGYSSLSYLHSFPVDTLKIDRSFVSRLTSGGDTAIVFTILGLARSLHLEAVAEGVEEQEQWDILRGQGCETGQGYHFSPPVEASDLAALIGTRPRELTA